MNLGATRLGSIARDKAGEARRRKKGRSVHGVDDAMLDGPFNEARQLLYEQLAELKVVCARSDGTIVLG